MPRFPFPVEAAVPLYLAPMAGVSESPFRRLCRRFGADVVVTEFLSAEGIRRENEATISKLRFGEDERRSLFNNTLPEQRFYNRTVVIEVVPEL